MSMTVLNLECIVFGINNILNIFVLNYSMCIGKGELVIHFTKQCDRIPDFKNTYFIT